MFIIRDGDTPEKIFVIGIVWVYAFMHIPEAVVDRIKMHLKFDITLEILHKKIIIYETANKKF